MGDVRLGHFVDKKTLGPVYFSPVTDKEVILHGRYSLSAKQSAATDLDMS